jgi:hypothetical protein
VRQALHLLQKLAQFPISYFVKYPLLSSRRFYSCWVIWDLTIQSGQFFRFPGLKKKIKNRFLVVNYQNLLKSRICQLLSSSSKMSPQLDNHCFTVLSIVHVNIAKSCEHHCGT